MVAGIKGKIIELLPNEVCIETSGGLVYLVHINKETFSKLNQIDVDKEVYLRTEYIVNESSAKLYGFLDSCELTMFRILLKVPRVGPQTALNICAEISLKELHHIVTNNDTSAFSKIKGVGVKSGNQIIFHLIQKKLVTPLEDKEIENFKELNAIKDALNNLGFKSSQYSELLKKCDMSMPIESIIKEVIKNIK